MSGNAAKMRALGGDAFGGLAMVGILALTIMPLPAFMLDFLLATSLCVSLLVFLVAVYVERPLDFSAFPSLLVLVTLFRLSLNVASTRMILLKGGEGTAAAGEVIRAFGDFAVGGNYVVGAVVFLILVLVNFIVITKGADRISEVSARFTLDSLPGKQMAIDSDLVAGLLDEKTARERRAELQRETEFHGAMDGASKFVRGDAIAGLIVVAINVVAGIIVGVAQHGMPFGDAAATYTVLSIGDGLVSQLPALLVSTGAALLVTRDSSGAGLMGSVGGQLFDRPKPMAIVSGIAGFIALLPGMPHLAMLTLALGAGVMAFRSNRRKNPVITKTEQQPAPTQPNPAMQKQEIESMLPLDLLSMEVGVGLLPLVDQAKNGELLGRIASLRKQLALELGFIVPAVHIRDELRLRPGGYRILISGVKVAEGEVRTGRMLAIHPSAQALAGLAGELVKEPTFGLPGRWIVPSDRSAAEALGCTVVDPSAVVATHLTEIVRAHAHELLGRRETQELLEIASKSNAKLVEELIPHLMSLGDLIRVLRALLAEGVSIRDARTVLETLADHAAQTKDPSELTEVVRQRLGRQITAKNITDQGELRAFVLDPRAEDVIRRGARGADARALSKLTTALARAAEDSSGRDEPPVLVVAPDVRRAVAAIAKRHIPGLSVLSYRELDANVPFSTSLVIGIDPASGGEATL